MHVEHKHIYVGELEQKLGVKEAAAHIQMGKYEKGEDAQGTAMYRKVQWSEAKEAKRGVTLSVNADKQLHDMNEVKQLSDGIWNQNLASMMSANASSSSTPTIDVATPNDAKQKKKNKDSVNPAGAPKDPSKDKKAKKSLSASEKITKTMQALATTESILVQNQLKFME